MQSEPVSPPPMTTTCLPAAGIGSLEPIGFCRPGGSAAAESPWRNGRRRDRGPATGRSRGASAPPASATASYSSTSEAALTSLPTCDVAMERHSLGPHLRDAALDVALLHLEVGDAVAQQAAGLGRLLVDMDLVAGARELLGGGEARRTGADDGDALAGLRRRAARARASPFPGADRRSRTRWS